MRRGIQIAYLLPVVVVCFFFSNLPAHADDIYVASYWNNVVYKFTSSGQQSVFASSDLSGPAGLAFDNSGNLYVANSTPSPSGGTIEKFDSNGNGTLFASNLSSPDGLAFDSSGNLYAAMNISGKIMKFDSSGHATVFASGLLFPYDIAFDISGNLYVANAGGNSIVKFDPSGNRSVFVSGITYPRGVALDGNGNIYVDDNSARIWKFDSSGHGLVFATNPFSIDGLACDSSGNLYVAASGNNTVLKFDPNGQRSVFANSGFNSPQAVAVRSVPEPATWTLLVLAVCVLFGNCRLRHGSS